MTASKGTIIEGLYELTDDGEDLGAETRFVGRRLSDDAKVDVRIVGPSASAAARKQFSMVAAILGRVNDRNCLSALGAGQLVDRSLYTVTEMAVAGPLTGMIGQSLPDRELVEVGLQLARGLQHLHNQGIVLGRVTPEGVVLGDQAGRPRLQIVDFSSAHVLGQQHEPTAGVDPQWLAPELNRGQPETEASDIFSVGRVLWALSSPNTSPEIVQVIAGLLAAEPGYRPLASEVCFRFTEFVEECSRPFSLEWLPSPEITAISSGIFERPATEEPGFVDSSADLPASHALPPSTGPVFEERPASRRGLAWGLLVAAVAAAGLVLVALSSRGESPASTDSAPVLPAASVAGAMPANAGRLRQSAHPSEFPASDTKPDGNPIVWLAQVNRTDLGAVLTLRQRRRLLSALAEREGVNERVNERWNAMLDLWQANDADHPCATFAAALATLEGSPEKGTERDLIDRVVVPTSAPGSRAGVAPDDSCAGLVEAFEEFKAVKEGHQGSKSRHRSRRRSSRRNSDSSSAAQPSPPAAAPPVKPSSKKESKKERKVARSKPSSVSTKLDDDLRDL